MLLLVCTLLALNFFWHVTEIAAQIQVRCVLCAALDSCSSVILLFLCSACCWMSCELRMCCLFNLQHHATDSKDL